MPLASVSKSVLTESHSTPRFRPSRFEPNIEMVLAMPKRANRANREAQYRIGMADLGMDSLWDPEASKYQCLCRMVHVARASLYIAYAQMFICFVFSLFFSYYYLMAISGYISAEHWINQYTARFISNLLFAIALQLAFIVVMIHGIRTERRSLLLPYLVFSSIAIFIGIAQLINDFFGIMRMSTVYNSELKQAYNHQFIVHVIGTMIHLWCLSVVWRCYGYFGDKKVARQIGEQLTATHVAFQYPDLSNGYVAMCQPPPYADTVLSAGAAAVIPDASIGVADAGDKQPLTLQQQK
ncbi:hypothetical protein L596_010272 [Steinernema carpocapsae]|uniref:Uncharacterized protein n=1 Tax=Steinernema carpocapsae TaxID=34508 RepID=A0A4U5PIB6_STECR|nr:hypothetical protein L596_010272 [Steinernema carpocapsae]